MTMSLATSTSTSPTAPVPWRRLGWVSWRRYRTTLVAVAALLGVLAILLVLRGREMRDAYATVQSCLPQASAVCGFA